jgi:hypothetical protein
MGASKDYLLDLMWLEERLCPFSRKRHRTVPCDRCSDVT